VHVARRARKTRADPAFAGAVVVGLALRGAWAIWATRAPPSPLSDPGRYLEIARGFAHGHTMALGSVPSAFWPPGYPLALVPMAWISSTGLVSLPFAASLLNVVAGTLTVALTGVLAGLWIGAAARPVAAWFMAVAPGPIFLTSTALSETWFTMVALGFLVLVTLAVDRCWSRPAWVGIGLIAGYAVLTRTPGVVLLAAPLLAAKSRRGSWRAGLGPTAAVVLGTLVALAPWAVRNGVQVGVWTPASTNNVAFGCIGNGPGSDGTDRNSAATNLRCFRHSVYDNAALPYGVGEVPAGVTLSRPDEPRWYATTARVTAAWMLHHPGAQPRLVGRRLAATFAHEHEALSDAEGFGRRPLMGSTARHALQRLGDLWLWAVSVLSTVGLARVARCRRALPIWGLAALQVVLVVPGIGLERYHQPIVPLLAVLAAGAVTARRGHPGSGTASLAAVQVRGAAAPVADAPRAGASV
jgi:hypothetical protein